MDYNRKNENDGICTDPKCPIAKPHCHLPRGGRCSDALSDTEAEKQDENG